MKGEKKKMIDHLLTNGFQLETLYLLNADNLWKLADEYGYKPNVTPSIK